MDPLYEEFYNRLRGKVPMGNLKPLPAPTPGMLNDDPDPAYTPRENPLNVMGQRIMNVVEDPRNAWIGLGPIGMATKIPKAAKGAVKYIPDTFEKMAAEGRTSSANRVVGKIEGGFPDEIVDNKPLSIGKNISQEGETYAYKRLRQDAIDSLTDDEIPITEVNIQHRMNEQADLVEYKMGDRRPPPNPLGEIGGGEFSGSIEGSIKSEKNTFAKRLEKPKGDKP